MKIKFSIIHNIIHVYVYASIVHIIYSIKKRYRFIVLESLPEISHAFINVKYQQRMKVVTLREPLKRCKVWRFLYTQIVWFCQGQRFLLFLLSLLNARDHKADQPS